MADKILIDQWIDLADEDFGFACSCLNDLQTNYFGQICFHFQQAAEKYLKSYIVAKNLRFEKIHDLNVLRDICFSDNPNFSTLTTACVYLNSFYIETRYPAMIALELTREIALKAKGYVEQIGDFVKNCLNNGH